MDANANAHLWKVATYIHIIACLNRLPLSKWDMKMQTSINTSENWDNGEETFKPQALVQQQQLEEGIISVGYGDKEQP